MIEAIESTRTIRRATSVNVITLSLGTAANIQILPFNRKRSAIIFPGSTGNIYTVGWQPVFTSGQGIIINASAAPLILTDRDLGSVICLPMYGIAGTTGRVITFYEIQYDDDTGNIFDSQLPVDHGNVKDPLTIINEEQRSGQRQKRIRGVKAVPNNTEYSSDGGQPNDSGRSAAIQPKEGGSDIGKPK